MAAAAYPARIGSGSCLRDGHDDELGQPPLQIGERVYWLGEDEPEPGVVKWIGLLPDVCDEWTAGVALDNQVGGMNGTWAGRVLFSCKQNHGIVISVNGLIKEEDFLGNATTESVKANRPVPVIKQNGHRGDPDGAQPPSCSTDGDGMTDSKPVEVAPTSVNRGDLEIGRFLSTRNNSRSSSFDRRVYARMFAECEVEKWYEALDFSSPDVTGSFSELNDVTDPFPTGRHGCTPGTSVTMPGSRVGDSCGSKRPAKKKERGGIFRFFRWLRRSRSSSKVSSGASISSPTQASTCPQKRRTLPHVGATSVDMSSASKRAHSLESVTSISDSFHYIPVGELRAQEEGTIDSTATMAGSAFDPSDQFYEDLDVDGNVLTAGACGVSRASPPKVKSNSLSRTMTDEREKRRREILGDSHRSERSVRSVCGAGPVVSGSSRKKRRAPLPPPANQIGVRNHWVKVLPGRQSSIQSANDADRHVVANALGRTSAGSTSVLYGASRGLRHCNADDPAAASTPQMKRSSSMTSAEVEGRLPPSTKSSPISTKPVRAGSYVRNKKRAPLPPVQPGSPQLNTVAATIENCGSQVAIIQIKTAVLGKDEKKTPMADASLSKSIAGGCRPVSIFRCHLEGVGLVNDSQVLIRTRSDKDEFPIQPLEKALVGSEAVLDYSKKLDSVEKVNDDINAAEIAIDQAAPSGNLSEVLPDENSVVGAPATGAVLASLKHELKEFEAAETRVRRSSRDYEYKFRAVRSATASPVVPRAAPEALSQRKQSASSFNGFPARRVAQNEIPVTSVNATKRNSQVTSEEKIPSELRTTGARRISIASLGPNLDREKEEDSENIVKPIEVTMVNGTGSPVFNPERRNSRAPPVDRKTSLEHIVKIAAVAKGSAKMSDDVKDLETEVVRKPSVPIATVQIEKESELPATMAKEEKWAENRKALAGGSPSPAVQHEVVRGHPVEWRRNSRTSSSDSSENQSPRLQKKLEIEEEVEVAESREECKYAAVAASDLVRAENKVNLQALQDLVESLVLQYCETAKIEDKVRKRDEEQKEGGASAPLDLVSNTITTSVRTAPVSAVPQATAICKESLLEARLRKLSERTKKPEVVSDVAVSGINHKENDNSKIYEDDDSKIYEDDGDNLANELLERWQLRMRNQFMNFDLGINKIVNADRVQERMLGTGAANDRGTSEGVYEPIGHFLQDGNSGQTNRNSQPLPTTQKLETALEGGKSKNTETLQEVDEDGIPADPFLFWRDLCRKKTGVKERGTSGGEVIVRAISSGDVSTRSTSGGEVTSLRSSVNRKRRSIVANENEDDSDGSNPPLIGHTDTGMRHAYRLPPSPIFRMYENVSMSAHHGRLVGPFAPVSHQQAPWLGQRFVHPDAYVMSAAVPDPRLCRPPFDPATGFPLLQRPGTVFPHYPPFVGAYPTATRLPYAAGYFYPAPPSALLVSSTSNPLYERNVIDHKATTGRQANSSTNGTRERPPSSSSTKNPRPAFQQQSRHQQNGVTQTSSAKLNRLDRRSSSEDSWGDALEGDSDSSGKKVYANLNDQHAGDDIAAPSAAVRKKRESLSDLPPVPPPRASALVGTGLPAASRLAAGSSWLKESSKSVEAKIKAAQQSNDPPKSTSLKRTASLGAEPRVAFCKPDWPVGAGTSLPCDFRRQRASMDACVMIGGVRVPTPLKLWPLEYELIAPELRMVQARLAGRPLPEDVSLEESDVCATDVNGLAVKRLLKLLEVSIGEGQLEEAATYARDLAQLKIQCCVTLNRQPANSDGSSLIILNMFVEDKVSHHGPIPIRVSPSINVGELKTKIFHEFEFPVQIQRWILGKKLAMDDSASLSQFGITSDGCPVFLYLISLDDASLRSNDLVWDTETNQLKATNKSRRSKIKTDIDGPTSRPTSHLANRGWTCTKCKQLNSPARLACSFCKCERPANYRSQSKCNEQPEEDTDSKKREREEEEKAIAEAKEIARLQNWQQYLQLDDQDLIFNQSAFECSVCFGETPPGEGVQLRDCLHLFCCDCLRNAVFHSDAATVGCPFRDDHYSCDSTLQEREIRALVPPDVFERHLQRSVVTAESQAPNSFHCKTPDCQGWCLIEEKVNEFLCPACQRVSCITCRVNHQTMNCRQYQDQLDVLARTDDEARKTKEAVESMLARGEAMNCPSCAVVIMKKWGCDWLACSICKTEICWVTKGPRWGPKGRGDTTAGCRCGINGIKCHQQCNYCH